MTKRKMIKFSLDEISAVDEPAQGEARAVIMKRKENSSGNPAADEAASGGKIAKEQGVNSNMSDANDKTAELEKRLEQIEAEKENLSVLAKMSDKEKKAMEDMSEEEKKKYMSKSQDERLSELAKAAESDPVIYKSLDGEEFRKSEKAMADVVKRADEMQKKLDDQIAKAETAELEKRAGEVFKNLKGEVSVKAKLLKAAEAIGDDAVDILKAADSTMELALKESGVSNGADLEKGKDMTELVKKYQDQGMSKYNATVAAAKEAREG